MWRLQRFGIYRQLPGALPQAVTLRTFGADKHVHHTIAASSKSLPLKGLGREKVNTAL